MKKTTIFVILIFLIQICITSALSQTVSLSSNNLTKTDISLIEEANYIIITTDELIESVEIYKTWREYPDFSVEIIDIQWILENYNGIDVQEQIRNFLIDKYENWDINYLMIVGSRNIIPMRRCDPITWDYGDYCESDYYYSDITGDWDLDGDGIYAEYGDDIVDFTPEISVGRIPSDDEETVSQIFENIMNYGSDIGAWKKNALLLGAISYYQGQEAYGWVYDRSDCATLMEECKVDFLDPKGFNCVRMYEAEGLRPSTYDYEYPLERSNVKSEWTNNYAIVNMVGHSNERSAARYIWDNDDGDNIPEVADGELIFKDFLTINDAYDLSLEKPPIVFSGGCSQLHGPNNMGRRFIENNAAVAYIGSTDLGFYNVTRVWNDESDGGFSSMDYYFFYYLIAHDQPCGDALANSKLFFSNHFMFTEYNPEWIYRSYSTILATTLYGDPALSILPISNPPDKPSTPDGPNSGRINVEYDFRTSCEEFDNDQVRYLFDWGDGNNTLTEYYASGQTVSESYSWSEKGNFDIGVRAQDENGVWSEWSDPLPVNMPKSKSAKIYGISNIIENLVQKFPILSRIFTLYKL